MNAGAGVVRRIHIEDETARVCAEPLDISGLVILEEFH
jgi:hypothetical protein